jgi:hypothetical protein
MTAPIRATPDEVYPRVKSGEALLVCAYNDDDKFRTMQLEGAISLSEFDSRLSQYPRDQEIFFY